MKSGRQFVRWGVVALMISCLGIAGCNRHQAHDEDDDDSDSAPAAAGGSTAPQSAAAAAPAASASASTSASSAMPETATTAPSDQGAPAPAETTSAPPEPASEPAPAEAPPAKHERAPKAMASSDSSSASSETSSARVKHAAAAPVTWWTASASSPLSVLAVGPAAGMSGIVVLASKDLGDAAAAGTHIKVVRDGKTVGGSWHAGANGRVLVLDSLKPGRYDMSIDGDLAGADGQKLGTKLHGPVFVR